MIRKRVPRQLWDYGAVWVAETMSMTHSSACGLNGGIPIEGVTGETPDISEYLDFGFYDKVWYKDNAGLYPSWRSIICVRTNSTSTIILYIIYAKIESHEYASYRSANLKT